MGLCEKSDLNKFIIRSNYTSILPIKQTVLTDYGTNDFSYVISKTGYYCVAAYNPRFDGDKVNNYKLTVNFHNAFGNLPASEIPKLPLYGLLAVVYAVCLCVYMFQVYKHRSELLLLQKYLAAFFVFLTVENILIWSLYDVKNNNTKFPVPAGIKFYIFVISCLSAFKISFSLFLLLIISLGYGVVFPKLNRKVMLKCKIIAGLQFVFSVLFIWTFHYSSQAQPGTSTTDTSKATNSFESNSWLVIIFATPLAMLFVVFYFLILNAQQKTVKLLQEKRQIVKLNMYRTLFKLIFCSLLLMVFGFIVTSVLMFNDSLTDSIERLWKFNDVLIDVWPSFLYFIIFTGIAIIWRPTDSSYLLAASSQLPTSEGAAGADDDDDPANNVQPYDNLEQFGNEFEFDDLRSLESGVNEPGQQNANPFQHANKSTTALSAENPFADTNALSSKEIDAELEQQKKILKQSPKDSEFALDDDDATLADAGKKKD
ncbi:unnamed protein product [Ambrosiozyma monospora]|uniref:Unnamed protein product n=1 Tax=Ambrosiozyma monospora TaxID=43982 RepID=A0ACB5T439_AMBMO|nr:unnamed protein product [Ambrosiozyma monospora]